MADDRSFEAGYRAYGTWKKRYGHGIRLNDDTRQWGTKKNSWMEMCEEEIIDGVIYAIADHLRRNK
jgi:hypothetical protein